MKASALTALLIGASTLALATRAQAQEVVFADNADLAAAALRGERVTQGSGVTQIRLSSGAMLSFVEGAEFQLRPDGSVDLFKGNVTVTGAGMSETLVRLGGQGTGKIAGAGSSGSFSVSTDASGKTMATGRVLTGLASIANGREERRFNAGQAWEVANGHPRLATSAPVAPAPRMTPQRQAQLAANTSAPAPAPTPAPEPQVAAISEGGPVAAAENGVPVVLGEALAAAGASGDIVSSGQRIEAAVANPSLETFPANDLAALVAYAARLESLYGGQPFNQAQADVIRAYLNYLASGQTQAQFLTVYAGLMVQFLDLVRSGAAPSSFSGTSLADINAFISYRSRTDGFAALSSQNRVLVDAYLAFVLGGGNADQFVSRYTSLTSAYFAYLRSGGDPLAFAGATQATLNAYISFLNDSGLLVRLAETDRALLQAYLANGGTAFIQQYRTALNAYFAYLQSGQLPSQYAAADPAALRQYLETLQATGLFEQVLGAQATFYAQYLAFLKQGGTIDGWQGLPANVFAGYATALSSYQAYLAAGGLPSAYTALDPAVLRQYLDALAAAGALDRFLGAQATFYAQYLAYLTSGGSIDGWQGLPFNVFTGYATALQAYYEFLQNGGLPSAYTALTQDEIRQYLAALAAVGANEAFLGQLASFYSAFFTYLANGGNPDLYTGLPTPPNYEAFADALSAYVAYLQAGGLPSAYTGADLALLQQYIKALIDSGKLATLLGAQAEFLTAYYAFLTGGGTPDGYTALPVYATYVTALEAYYAFLANGGKPSEYTLLTQAQILAYLKALTDAGVLAALFDGATLAFIESFYVYLAGGGNPDLFSGLPGSGGGTGGGTGGTRLTTYTGGFPSNALGSKAIAGHNGNIQPANSTPTVNAAGELETAGDIATLGAKVTDVAGDASAIVGRYYDGNARFKNSQFGFGTNNGMPYVVLAPKGGTLPVSGTVDYKVLAATRPVYSDGRTAPGTFDAALTIGFSSNNRNLTYRTLGTIVMPESGGDVTYTFSTPNYANGQMQEVIYDSLGNYFFGNSMTGTGQGCVAGGTPCNISFYGDFAGQEQVNRLGLMYQTYGGSFSAGRIQGAVIFGKDGTLPGGTTGGGTGGGVLTSYTGGFDGASPRINFITTLRISSTTLLPGSEFGFNALSYTLDSNGGLTSYTRDGGFTRTPGTMTISDVAGDADVLVGRWSDGTNTGANTFTLTADQGFHYMLTRPTPSGFAAPTTGVIQYDLLAATKPTWVDGSGAPGTFAGSFKVNFGLALPKIGMEAKIVMPTGGTGGGAYTFDFRTTGGLADITQSTSNFSVLPNLGFSFIVPGDDQSGNCNSNICYLAAVGNWAGSNDKLGLTYTAYSAAGNAKSIIGAAAFKVATGSGSGSGSGGSTPTAAPDGIVKYVGYLGGGRFSTFENAAAVTTNGNGGLTKVDGFYELNGASNTDAGNANGIVAWSRWIGGGITGLGQGPTTTLGNGGLANVWGKPATNIPTTGKIDYQVVGSTRPSTTDAVVGTLDNAKLAVDFSAAKVGFEAALTVSGAPVTMSSSGGAAAPSLSLRASGTTFGANTNQMTLTGASGVSIEGFLAGVGATHAGVGYYLQTTTGNVAGAIAFGPKAP